MVYHRNFLFGFVIVATLLFVSFISNAEIVDAVRAIVNNDIILTSELETAIKLYEEENSFEIMHDDVGADILEQLSDKILLSIIDEKLIEQEVERSGITATSEEVDTAVKRIKDLNNNLSEILLRDGVSLDSFRQDLRRQICKSKLIDRNVYSKIIIDEDKIKNYYDSNFHFYDGELKYHLCSIFIELPIDTSDEMRAKNLDKIHKVSKHLNSGVSFDQVVGSCCSDKGWRVEYLGEFKEGDLSFRVKKAIDGLTIGDCTPVMDTELGFQFFYIKEITKTKVKRLNMVRDEIYQKLLFDESNREFSLWLNSVKNRSFIKIFN